MPRRKELHFFDRADGRDLDRYRRCFAGAEGHPAIGEATPTYLFSPDAVRRLTDALPDARLIVSLRDPVDRAYSHYWFRRCWDAEDRTFDDAVRAEMSGTAVPGAEYLARGRYVEQLERLDRLGAADRTHVLVLDDLRADPDATVERVYRFVGVDPHVRPDVDDFRNSTYRLRWPGLWNATARWRHRDGGVGARLTALADRWNAVPFDYPPMDPALREELAALFAPGVDELRRRLGRALPGWPS